jgi:MFS transporter, FHS family, glucose/mannose:H+ symporter
LASTTLRSNLPTEPAPEPRASAANTAPAIVPWMAGFFLCGCLLGMLGSLVVAWRYYIDVDSRLIGLHFLVFDAGMLAVHFATRRRAILASARFLALIASAVAVAGLVGLSFALPPASVLWRLFALLMLGSATGAVFSGLFQMLRPWQMAQPAVTLNLNGVFFGMGALFVTLLIGGTYRVYSAQIEMLILAAIPLVFLLVWWTRKDVPAPQLIPPVRFAGFSPMAAVLFGLLLFFQFGNEWCLSAWLPLFLIRRLGCDPGTAIFVLGLFFFALVMGRLAAQTLLTRVSHTKLLVGGTLIAVLGYIPLSMTKSVAGAAMAVVIIGCGFATIYPLVAEKAGKRFVSYPGFYDAFFVAATSGAIFAPWLLGYVDHYFGLSLAMLIPAFGTVAVFVLVLMIMLEAKLMTEPKAT